MRNVFASNSLKILSSVFTALLISSTPAFLGIIVGSPLMLIVWRRSASLNNSRKASRKSLSSFAY